jgi:hypothetical protein
MARCAKRNYMFVGVETNFQMIVTLKTAKSHGISLDTGNRTALSYRDIPTISR